MVVLNQFYYRTNTTMIINRKIRRGEDDNVRGALEWESHSRFKNGGLMFSKRI